VNFEPDAIARILAVSAPALVALAGALRGPGALRSRLRHDIELLNSLPTDSAAHTNLLQHIEHQLLNLSKLETEGKRDWQGLIISAVLVLAFAAGAYWFIDRLTWWGWVTGGTLALFALVGLGEVFGRAQRVPRDNKGNKLT